MKPIDPPLPRVKTYLIKGSGPEVYAHKLAQRRLVPDQPTLSVLILQLGQVHILPDATLKKIALGPPLPSRANGKLYKSADPSIYFLSAGWRRLVPDSQTFSLMGLKAEAVATITTNDLEDIPEGEAIPSRRDGNLYKVAGPAVYIMQTGQRRWIPDPATFYILSLDWGAVKVVSDADLDAIPLGPPITSRAAEVVNVVRNLVDGNQVLPQLLQDLGGAEQNINISMYLFVNDPIGQEIAAALRAKASDRTRPVKVRVLLDVAKSQLTVDSDLVLALDFPDLKRDYHDIAQLCDQLQKAGVEVHKTNIDYRKRVTTGNAVFDADAAAIRRNVNVTTLTVDHRKMVTVDGRVAYCGSANMAASYLYHEPFDPALPADQIDHKGKEPWNKWHDGLVRFEGPIVALLDQVFRERWVLDGGRDFKVGAAVPAPANAPGHRVQSTRVVTGQPDGTDNPILALFEDMIGRAQSSIFIENPYLVHPRIAEALRTARKKNSGLRVDLVVPATRWDDNILDNLAQRSLYLDFVPHGIRVHEYQNRFNHLKLATFDDRFAIVGSANLNWRSLEKDRDFELVILVDDPGFAQEVNANVRDVDIARSRQFKEIELPLLEASLLADPLYAVALGLEASKEL
jgi:phosphatidylserine/phosphatidylglycerophosphate/cardiolipin synthase-like enzyme